MDVSSDEEILLPPVRKSEAVEGPGAEMDPPLPHQTRTGPIG